MNTPQSHRDTELDSIGPITRRIIGCAIEVHKVLGPGLLESIYESAMDIELDEAQLEHKRQVSIPAHYKGRLLGQYRVDLIVQDLVLVEIKSVERPLPVFEAQLLTYMRVLHKRVGLLINFNSRLLTEGITRLAL
jgi:GxxExxY protein